MKKSTFRIGIIGTGGIAQAVHIPGWRNVPGVEIVGMADINLDHAKKAAAQAGIAEVFEDYNDLLRLDLDAVDICTPNRVHTPAVLAALNAGVPVMCEKPLAVSTAEVRKMGQLADKKKLILMTAQNNRFRSETIAIKNWAEAGNLGEVYHARVRATRRAWMPTTPGFIDAKLAGGGPCMDIGVHALDAALWIMGFPQPVRVSGTAKVNFAHGHKIENKWGDWDRKLFSVEDFAAGFIHFSNGATMTLEASWLGHQTEDEDVSFNLLGTNGGVTWPSGEVAGFSNGTFTNGRVVMPNRIEATHWEEIKQFHRAVAEGLSSPVPWTQTIRVIAILEAIYESQRLGREVALK